MENYQENAIYSEDIPIYKKTTIFDLINEPCLNPLFLEITNPLQALIIMSKMGDVRAQIAYLKVTNPAKWDDKSKEYKERMRKEEARPMFIGINEVLTKEELNEYRELNENEQEEYLKTKWRERNQ